MECRLQLVMLPQWHVPQRAMIGQPGAVLQAAAAGTALWRPLQLAVVPEMWALLQQAC